MGGLITPLIQARVDYQEAARHGMGVTEINPHGAAAAEIKALWSSIKRRLARGKAKATVSKAA
jgi:chromosome partitioning protein